MKKRILFSLVIGVLIISACSAGIATGTSTAQSPAVSVTMPAPQGAEIEAMLAVGTLALEGTENAVTAEQAKNLLPLWKAINTLSSSDTSTQAEIQAVYKQIQGEMTAAQLAAIQALDLSGDKMADLMNQYGIQPGDPVTRQQGNGGGSSSGIPAGGFPGGAVPPGGGVSGGAIPSGRGQVGGTGPSGEGPVFEFQGEAPPDMAGAAQETPGAPSGRRGMFMNTLFVQPLIDLLKERVG